MAEFHIGDRLVSPETAPLVIVEIGINHGGSLDVAKHMVDAAVAAGAEVIKHQTHIVEDEMAMAAQTIQPDNADRSIYDLMSECALNEDEEWQLKCYVEQQGAIFISTPFSRAAAERLAGFDVCAYKIGSGECNNYPLLTHVAKKGKPVILSTGMNDLDSVGKAVDIFRQFKIPFALLHCTNIYPTPPELVRLGAIKDLQQAFPDAVVGLSDHTIGNYTCFGAVALGAAILERHFTDSMDRVGPDIVCSMDPKELKDLITGADILFKARGGGKTVIKEEQSTRDFAFASVVTIADVKQGETFTEGNIWVKRPGTGEIPARDYNIVLGCRAARHIAADQLLTREDVLRDG